LILGNRAKNLRDNEPVEKTVTHLMLSGVQQHPDLFLRLAFKETCKHCAASRAGVVLFDFGVFLCACADQIQCVVRMKRRRPPVEVCAWRARLNPEFHVRTAEAHAENGEKA
jgi:hypothetical protein